MPQHPQISSNNPRRIGNRLSLDAWAVALALGLAVLIWTGVIKHIPW